MFPHVMLDLFTPCISAHVGGTEILMRYKIIARYPPPIQLLRTEGFSISLLVSQPMLVVQINCAKMKSLGDIS